MRRYRLKVSQRREHEDFEKYLNDILERLNPCVTIVNRPRRKSIRKMPDPGIKWIDGIVDVIPEDDCYRQIRNSTTNNEYFTMVLVRINMN